MPIIARIVQSVVIPIVLGLLAIAASAQEPKLIAGQNINMVSGTEWPDGDPYLQRQNEGTLAVSTRNPLHLMGGSNDYRTIDLPFLPGSGEGKTVGDSWVSTYFSIDGGGRWTSTLLPGYPQDTSALGGTSPLKQALDGAGYEASADPVIRAGTHGLFYYSGIAFTRGDAPPSAGFVATYMDLNNDERKHSIGYVRTTVYDENIDGSSFIDKPWIAIDKPRNFDLHTFDVIPPDGGIRVSQTVECGNVYVAYARIEGDGSAAIRSQIMFTRSEDCAASFLDEPIQLSLPNTINQGAAVAIDPFSGRIQVAWRQFENATLSCTLDTQFWQDDPDAWPVNELELAGITYESDNTAVLFPGDDEKGGTPWLVLRQLLGAWLNILSGADNSDIVATLAAAEEWLFDFPPGSKPNSGDKKTGNALRKLLLKYNNGNTGPGSCDALLGDGINDLLSGLNPSAIMVVTSTDSGDTWSAPVAVTGADYFPFEQGTTEFSFRTTGFATSTFDGDGRSYIAYSTRGIAIPDADPVGGDARIVVTTSMNGTDWTPPQPIDEPSVPGHQIMPAFEFSRGKLFLLYYDFREDVSGVFDRFITDFPVDLTTPRHSADVRVAQAVAADVPIFTDYSVLDSSTQASRYSFLILTGGDGNPYSQQMTYNPPNLPMFKGGTVPFFGDYLDLAALSFINDKITQQWEFDTDPATGAPVVHAVWTDNRDVVGPPFGDWTTYVPPGNDPDLHPSNFDPDVMAPGCSIDPFSLDVDRTKMRNQNIYTARLTQGLAVAVPGNNRPLGIIQRVFVGFVQNTTGEDKLFRLQILNQPVGGSASFDQFTLEMSRDEVVERNSSIARSIYVSSTNSAASIDISVVEIDLSGNPIVGGLTATTRINPDPSAPPPEDDNILLEEVYTPAIFNPAIFNPAIFNAELLGLGEIGIFDPAIFNPAIFNDPEQAEFISAVLMQLALLNPAIFNPAIFNPAIFNPAIFNPAIFNPAIFNPAIFNPAIFNPAIFNPAMFNPAIFNPAIFNPAIFNSTLVETSIVVENTGNATAAYSLNLDLDNPPAGFIFQVMIYRTYLVPSVEGCTLTETVVQEALVNELTPDVNGSLLSPDSTSFFVTPGDHVVITVRIIPDSEASGEQGDPTTIDALDELNLSQAVVPQAVDTEAFAAGETEPEAVVILSPAWVLDPFVITTGALPDGAVGVSYVGTALSATGGGGDSVSWSLASGSALPAGLSLATNGQISGTPTTDGLFMFTVRANDGDQIAEQSFSITVAAGGPALLPMISESSSFFGADTITLDPATGLRWLDVTESTAFSYDEILTEFDVDGVFYGYRLATSDEVLAFWQNAGINTGAGFLNDFRTENLQPVVDLMAFVGITGLNTGNLGEGNFFDFTAGHIESGPGGGGTVNVATISADPDPSMTGRPGIGFVSSSNSNSQHGAWLIFTGIIWRADFDLSALTPAGPYVCLRHTLFFDGPLTAPVSMTVNVFDNGSLIGSTPIGPLGAGTSFVGTEVFLSGTALADGIGFETIIFSQPTNLDSVEVEGRTGVCIGGGETGFVTATLGVP